MTSHSEIEVSAHIPDETGSRYIVDENGKRPSMPFKVEEHMTYEGTLDAISKKVIGTYGQIDKRLPAETPDHIVYQTKPVGETAIKAAYRWYKP